ncbi:hypothetical protein [Nocardiopsis baichengensis]|uniref:hypothetical protein n=1 Tax=Nocardiopsis baichengensis TaxID=280240 RepID=UPI000344C51C|nr:hypothetical protein [Nocardiopsis baichengensis]
MGRGGITGFRYEEVAESAAIRKASVYGNWPVREELGVEAVQRAGEVSAVRKALSRVLGQYSAILRRRVEAAAEKDELPPVDSALLGEVPPGPVHLIVNRGVRRFARADAKRIVGAALAGFRVDLGEVGLKRTLIRPTSPRSTRGEGRRPAQFCRLDVTACIAVRLYGTCD